MLGSSSNGNVKELRTQFMKKAIKKADKQSGPMKTMVWRSCMSALMILDEIHDIPFEKLSPSLYFISLDLKADELTKLYDAMLELAGIYPDKFVDRLHKDLNEISAFIRENNLLPELFEMITLCDRLRYTYLRENPQAIHVVNLPALKDGASETSDRGHLPSKLSRKVHFCDLSVRTLTLFIERGVTTPEGEVSTHLKVLGRLAFVRFVPRGSVHCHCSRSRCGHKFISELINFWCC